MFALPTKMRKGVFTLSKKIVLVTFVTDADTDLKAVFNLNKVFAKLSEEDLEKFDAFEVLDAE